jgi:hypothetical protein
MINYFDNTKLFQQAGLTVTRLLGEMAKMLAGTSQYPGNDAE